MIKMMQKLQKIGEG